MNGITLTPCTTRGWVLTPWYR